MIDRLCRAEASASTGHVSARVSRKAGMVALTAFFLLLVGLPVAARSVRDAWLGGR